MNINKDYVFFLMYLVVFVVFLKILDNMLKYVVNFWFWVWIFILIYIYFVNNCIIICSLQFFVGFRMKWSIQDEKFVGVCFLVLIDFLDGNLLFFVNVSIQVDYSLLLSYVDFSVDSFDVFIDMFFFDIERMEDEFIVVFNVMYDEKIGKCLIYGVQQYNFIVDVWFVINLYVMQVIGMGLENMDYYKYVKKVFLNIDNIYVMRDLFDKVISVIKDVDIFFFFLNRDFLMKSKWLKYIVGILDGLVIIVW